MTCFSLSLVDIVGTYLLQIKAQYYNCCVILYVICLSCDKVNAHNAEEVMCSSRDKVNAHNAEEVMCSSCEEVGQRTLYEQEHMVFEAIIRS